MVVACPVLPPPCIVQSSHLLLASFSPPHLVSLTSSPPWPLCFGLPIVAFGLPIVASYWLPRCQLFLSSLPLDILFESCPSPSLLASSLPPCYPTILSLSPSHLPRHLATPLPFPLLLAASFYSG